MKAHSINKITHAQARSIPPKAIKKTSKRCKINTEFIPLLMRHNFDFANEGDKYAKILPKREKIKFMAMGFVGFLKAVNIIMRFELEYFIKNFQQIF